MSDTTPEAPKVVRSPMEAPRKLPPLSVRWCLLHLYRTNEMAAYCAALGVSWTGPGRPRTPWKPSDPAGYGFAVCDELLARDGVEFADIHLAGQIALGEMSVTLVGDDDVKAALGNSEGTAGPKKDT